MRRARYELHIGEPSSRLGQSTIRSWHPRSQNIFWGVGWGVGGGVEMERYPVNRGCVIANLR